MEVDTYADELVWKSYLRGLKSNIFADINRNVLEL